MNKLLVSLFSGLSLVLISSVCLAADPQYKLELQDTAGLGVKIIPYTSKGAYDRFDAGTDRTWNEQISWAVAQMEGYAITRIDWIGNDGVLHSNVPCTGLGTVVSPGLTHIMVKTTVIPPDINSCVIAHQ
jgi:hypothetical protein